MESKKERAMLRRLTLVVVMLCAGALGIARTAAADLGNTATNSIGTVQVGQVSVDPSVSASAPAAQAGAAAPTTVGGSGGNSASDSVGTVQVGGGNSASGSAGTVQTGPVATSPSVSVSVAESRAAVTAPAEVGGSGPNTSSNSVGAVQSGGGNSASNSIGATQVGGASAAPAIDVSLAHATGAAVDVPTASGGSGGNTATESVGSVQIGGRNAASGGTPPAGTPTTGVLGAEAATFAPETSVAGSRTTVPRALQAMPVPRTSRTLGASHDLNRVGRLRPLPFTGLRIWLLALLGLALAGLGATTRRLARAA
jgi:hypothetical protein